MAGRPSIRSATRTPHFLRRVRHDGVRRPVSSSARGVLPRQVRRVRPSPCRRRGDRSRARRRRVVRPCSGGKPPQGSAADGDRSARRIACRAVSVCRAIRIDGRPVLLADRGRDTAPHFGILARGERVVRGAGSETPVRSRERRRNSVSWWQERQSARSWPCLHHATC